MDGVKAWYYSNGCWANLLQIVTGFAVTGHVLTQAQASIINADGPALMVGLLTSVLGFWGLIGRIIAKKSVVA